MSRAFVSNCQGLILTCWLPPLLVGMFSVPEMAPFWRAVGPFCSKWAEWLSGSLALFFPFPPELCMEYFLCLQSAEGRKCKWRRGLSRAGCMALNDSAAAYGRYWIVSMSCLWTTWSSLYLQCFREAMMCFICFMALVSHSASRALH